ncbi:MAG: tail fiber domain-containing protein [Elusimicrobia bacterium]|nr:tail fiber domain-containing protein [Elusimicrobiota bacterium]
MAVSTGVTNMFWVAGDGAHAVKYYGDGSSLTGLSGADNLGDHTATQNLDMAQHSAVNVASIAIVGDGLRIGTDLTSSANGLFISTSGAIMTMGFGNGTALPNARGIGAVDLQNYRVDPASVASGSYAVITGGGDNAAGNTYAVVSGGRNNTASGSYAAVAGGRMNTASGAQAMAAGGWANTAGGSNSFAAGYNSASMADGAFTWSDSEGTQNINAVADRTVFKNRGGFLVTGSTNPVMSGTLDRGMLVTGNGLVGIATGTPQAALDVVAAGTAASDYAQIWRAADGTVVASMTATGLMTAGRFNIPAQYSLDLSTVNASPATPYGGVNITTNTFISGKVGVGTVSPTADLTVSGTEALLFGSDYTDMGNQYAANLGASSTVRYTGADAATFYGIVAGVPGQILHLHNASNYALTLANQSASATMAADRIITGTGGDVHMTADSSLMLQYDGTALRWRILGGSGSASGAGDNLGNHTATQDLDLAQHSAVNVASIAIVGNGLRICTDLSSSASGLLISTSGAIMTMGLGNGTALPNARGIGAVDLQNYRVDSASVASGAYAVIAGGRDNMASALYTTIGGGYNNTAFYPYSTVGGGWGNRAGGNLSNPATVSGGRANTASASNAVVGGGSGNAATASQATVSGGSQNKASGAGAVVSGGASNTAVGYYSMVPGGGWNTALGQYSFAAGDYSSSTADGSFTWSDSLGVANVNSVADRTVFKNRGGFLVTGSTNPVMSGTLNRGVFITGNGLVGISTGVPQAALDVVSSGTAANIYAQIWRDSMGVIVASMTSQGALYTTLSSGQGITASSVTLTNTAGAGLVVSSSAYLAVSGGNVGIGTASPSNKLHVEGTGGGAAGIYFNNAVPSATSYTLYNNNGTLTWNGNALGTSGASVSGTVNYIAEFTGTSAVGDSVMYETGGNVGIGTTGPAYKLHSAGTLGTGSTGTEGYLGFKRASDGLELASIKTDSTNNIFTINSGAGALTFQASGTEVARITGGGNVGFGTTNPSNKLHVEGTGGGAAGIYFNNAVPSATSYTLYNNNGTLTWNGNALGTSGASMSGTVNHIAKFTGTSAVGDSVMYETGGNVGIGTIAPANTLNIVGGAGNASSLATSQSVAALYVQPKNTSSYGLAFGSGLSNLPYIQNVTTNGAASGDISLQPYGGNVSIGPTTPNALLHLYAANPQFKIQSSGSGYRQLILMVDDTNGVISLDSAYGTTGPYPLSFQMGETEKMRIASDGNVGIGTTAPATTLEVNGSAQFGSGTAKSTFTATGNLQLVSGSTVTSNGTLTLSTAATAATATPNFFLDRSGNIGIGTAAPGGKLDVTQTAGGTTCINLNHTGATGVNYGIMSGISGAASSNTGVYINVSGATSGNYGLRIVSPTAAASNWAIYSDAPAQSYIAGNVGIGITAPTNKLYVLGENSNATSLANSQSVAAFYLQPKSGSGYGFAFGSGPGDLPYIQNVTTNGGASGDMILQPYGGNVGIGGSPGAFKLYIGGSLAVNSVDTEKTGTLAWTTYSDARLKDVAGSYTRGLKEILQINPIHYAYKINNGLNIIDHADHVGILAQDVQPVIPEAIATGSDGYLRFTADPVIWAAINAIKELKAENDALKARIEKLEGK